MSLLRVEKKSYHLPTKDSPPIKQAVDPELRKRNEELVARLVDTLNKNTAKYRKPGQ